MRTATRTTTPLRKYLIELALSSNVTSPGYGLNALRLATPRHRVAAADGRSPLGFLRAKWNSGMKAKNTIGPRRVDLHVIDGTTKGFGRCERSRTSDYLGGHFPPRLRPATGDTFWNAAIDLRDFLANHADGRSRPAPPAYARLPSVQYGHATRSLRPGSMGRYGNAPKTVLVERSGRSPWRFSSDYLLSGDAR